MQAAAVAAVAAAMLQTQNETTRDDSKLDQADNSHFTAANNSSQNIHRSSSHESHLRNRIQPPVLLNSNPIMSAKSSDISHLKSNGSCENLYRSNDGSDLISLGPSGMQYNLILIAQDRLICVFQLSFKRINSSFFLRLINLINRWFFIKKNYIFFAESQ